MRGAGGAVCVAIAALLVCCSADPHQETDVNGGEPTRDRYELGHKTQDVDHQGGANLVREVRETGHGFIPYLMSRPYKYPSQYGGGAGAGGKNELWPVAPPEFGGYYGDGLPKRNFDEIDRSGLNSFIKKRNFDEIDQTSMPFPYAKRFYRPYSFNHYDIDMPVSSFDKKRFRPDYPMDEIDLSHFPIGSKRSQVGFHALR